MKAIIETERLRLRAWTEADLDVFYLLGTDPDAIRYAQREPYASRAHALEVLHAAPLRDYAEHGFGRFACEWKASGEVIGFSGLKYLPEFNEVELGYRFLPAWWGKGLATEAGQAGIAFARDTLELRRIISVILPENTASANVVRKLGLSFERSELYAPLDNARVDIWARSLV
ncbi:GNAT family N-acetyltransferase [Niveibacterium sp. 24ML]|uniref:GNAT family N-acetyltransferase n=1 Tax=Niveibacterium sp. 24ML TaxID=2985512 RepID=UPI002270CAAC|nr:GNAT family N-acetyltransferase [Niveibacterium sp. 24ML]MCX9155450.1 GNAT family N-acetyltransferase [Niveibacterium sp. 24ML]